MRLSRGSDLSGPKARPFIDLLCGHGCTRLCSGDNAGGAVGVPSIRGGRRWPVVGGCDCGAIDAVPPGGNPLSKGGCIQTQASLAPETPLSHPSPAP